MQFDQEVIQNSFVLKDIKKYYNLNKLTWQLIVKNNDVATVCLDKNTNIKYINFLQADDRISFRRLETWGFGKVIPFSAVVYQFVNNEFDMSNKNVFNLFTSDNENYSIFFNDDYYFRDSFLIKIYE